MQKIIIKAVYWKACDIRKHNFKYLLFSYFDLTLCISQQQGILQKLKSSWESAKQKLYYTVGLFNLSVEIQ